VAIECNLLLYGHHNLRGWRDYNEVVIMARLKVREYYGTGPNA